MIIIRAKEMRKNLAHRVSEMYKFRDNQISFSDLRQPIGMKMSAGNRWVKKADSIPWGIIEKKYAKLFSNRKGNVAKPLRLALGAYIIQAEYGYSDVETVCRYRKDRIFNFSVDSVNIGMNRPLVRR